ncbi:sensor histidine kinase [Pedobacter antarcticus]|uniref:sensor histidine kinase n=1 Tax=Pedobacter antarcticus TaxID=34086 RepID=UPI000889AAA9|nr:histidine kinase [Pedobacter antarcticus]SDM02883.1 Histidine kinase [Pedobacter antarcticus]
MTHIKLPFSFKELQKTEFKIVSAIYAFAILTLISSGNNAHDIPYEFSQAGIRFNYIYNYFIPAVFKYSLLYFSFLLLNFCSLPALYRKTNTGMHLCLIFIVFVFAGLIISITRTYSQAFLLIRYDTIQDAYEQIFFNGFGYAAWLVVLIAIYVALKNLIFHFANQQERNDLSQQKLEILFGSIIWFAGILFWLATNAGFQVIICWTLISATAIWLFIHSVYELIPQIFDTAKKPLRTYLYKLSGLILISLIATCLLAFLISGRNQLIPIVIAFNLPVQYLITAPLAWQIYKRRNSTAEQIYKLKKELGQTDANLNFLKSQINPHFLFNALNTLYGTALQEKADRTSEGIQKLGDMMRFMLQENMQDKISLIRDLDYLKNYIDLQKLRTSQSVDITISTQIEEQFTELQISPMLLIPFVENAFKHGISLQQPSHIKITLQTKENTLYFDVHNSIHLKSENDPERTHSGIGLENVKQRLMLLYPGKHELLIRESAKEFFVHLTLKL